MSAKTRYAQQFLDNPPRGVRAFTSVIRVLYLVLMTRLGSTAHREHLRRIHWVVFAPQIFELRDAGLSANETAERLGIDVRHVRRVLHTGAF
jgi:hypothetical protein